MWRGRLRVIERGSDLPTECLLNLEDKDSGELFAQAPYKPSKQNPNGGCEAVLDSSRYFVLTVVDGTNRAYIGMGFPERSEAFDFNVALQGQSRPRLSSFPLALVLTIAPRRAQTGPSGRTLPPSSLPRPRPPRPARPPPPSPRATFRSRRARPSRSSSAASRPRRRRRRPAAREEEEEEGSEGSCSRRRRRHRRVDGELGARVDGVDALAVLSSSTSLIEGELVEREPRAS